MSKVKATQNKAENVETKLTKLALSIKDRLIFNELFPKQSDIIGQIIVRDIAEKLQITQVEGEKIGLKPREGGGFTWKNTKDKVVELTNTEMEFLRTQVQRLDKEKKVTLDLLELCLKIKG